MKSFLDEIGEELLKTGKTDFSDMHIVLPNRRAGVFFRDALSKQSNKAIWAPRVSSIEDFVFNLSGMVKVDRTTLLFSFYEVYCKQVQDPQSLEMFANWAATFLSDINEVDLNLIDAEDIFLQLYAIERIERWNPETLEPTDLQQRHLNFVKSLFGFYKTLRAKLDAGNLGYQGMAFRKVAENVEQIIAKSDIETVWFAGFNALTVSEEHIVNGWMEAGAAKIFWDMDSFYVDDPVHEAGHYIRKYLRGAGKLKVEKDFLWKRNSLREEQKDVHLIAVQRNVAQAQVAASILNEKLKDAPDGLLSNTVVILNDEALLMPLLHALPVALKGVNITMGYGLPHSQSAAFIDKMFGLYDRFLENDSRFYHQDVSAVLNDAFYLSLGDTSHAALQRSIVKEKYVFLEVEKLGTSGLNKKLFNTNMHSVVGFLKGLKEILSEIHIQLEQQQELQIEMEFLFLFDKLVQRLTDLIGQFGGIETIKTLHTFWRQLLRSEQLDFVGEPLRGLQIMGMLETRNLDFEEVIILGVNEGHLPSNSHSNSSFTFDVRRAYGLACSNERDAVTAYHFYRLLQRAKKVYLVYDQDTDSMGRGEVSRYVRQLQLEKQDNIRFYPWNVDQDIPDRAFATDLTIEKGAQEFEKIVEHAAYGFSPSALNTFRNCSLKYYFNYVAGYREQEELHEDIDHATFGTAVHNTLEALYLPYVGKPLSEDILKQFLKDSKVALKLQFDKELALDGSLEGRNLLAFEVGLSYVKKVVSHDIQTIKSGNIITPLQLEQQLKTAFETKIDGNLQIVKVKGLADRIDRLSDGTIRLIDYKTGTFDKTNSIKYADAFNSPKTDHAFQLLLYALMYGSENPKLDKIQPTVFYLRAKNVEHPITVFEEKVELMGQELIGYAEQRLKDVLNDLFDKQTPFSQTENVQTCAYCDFNQICER